MIIKVEVKSNILGDSVFWEGYAEDIQHIRNVPARMLAALVVKDGTTRKSGMWVVSVSQKGDEGD